MATDILGKIRDDMFQAVKDSDEVIAGIARLAMAALKNHEIEKGDELTEEEALTVLRKEVSQLKDAVERFEEAGRKDLAELNNTQLQYLNKYLPAMMTEDEIADTVVNVIKDVGATGASDMGKVMGQVMGRLKGKAEGDAVKRIVVDQLNQL